MTPTIAINANVQWRVARLKSGRFMAVCDPLGVTTEGDDVPDVFGMIGETMQCLFLDLLMDNELDKFLQDRGWSANKPHEFHPHEEVAFDVPWEVIMTGHGDPARTFN